MSLKKTKNQKGKKPKRHSKRHGKRHSKRQLKGGDPEKMDLNREPWSQDTILPDDSDDEGEGREVGDDRSTNHYDGHSLMEEEEDAEMMAFKTQIEKWQGSLNENYDMVDMWVKEIEKRANFEQLKEFLDKNENYKNENYSLRYEQKACPWTKDLLQAGREQRGGGMPDLEAVFNSIKTAGIEVIEWSTDIVAWIWEQVKNYTVRLVNNLDKLVNCLGPLGTYNFATLLISGYYLHDKHGPIYSKWVTHFTPDTTWIKEAFAWTLYYIGIGDDPNSWAAKSARVQAALGEGANVIVKEITPYLGQLAIGGALYLTKWAEPIKGLITNAFFEKYFMDARLDLQYTAFAVTIFMATLKIFINSWKSKQFKKCWNGEAIPEEDDAQMKDDINDLFENFERSANAFAQIQQLQLKSTEDTANIGRVMIQGNIPKASDITTMLTNELKTFNIIKEAIGKAEPEVQVAEDEAVKRLRVIIGTATDTLSKHKNQKNLSKLYNQVSKRVQEEEDEKIKTLKEILDQARKAREAAPPSLEGYEGMSDDMDAAVSGIVDAAVSDIVTEQQLTPSKERGQRKPPASSREGRGRPRSRERGRSQSPQREPRASSGEGRGRPRSSERDRTPDRHTLKEEEEGTQGGARKRRKTRKHRKRKTKKAKRTRKHKKSLKKKKRKTKKR